MARFIVMTTLFDSVATWEEEVKSKAESERVFKEMVSSGLNKMNTKAALVSIWDSKGKRVKREFISR